MVELVQNAENIEPMGTYTPIPIGEYMAMIVASEQKETKSGDGRYLNLTFEVLEPEEFKGRRVFDTLNLVNKNPQTVEIAQRRLSSIQRCVGVIHLRDSNELHNLPLVINVGIKPEDGQYAAKNIIKGFARTDGKDLKDVVAAASPVAKQPTSSQSATPLKPWQKKR